VLGWQQLHAAAKAPGLFAYSSHRMLHSLSNKTSNRWPAAAADALM